ncbi:hypothetical protein F5B22DRAFT_633136 [Xylaria bambusicola]|uniref:uncharacterized protein n=1 Tax=Xylaria bambusicola TaxID=326684 RepID=UPI002007498C|nr:uncharacterized protein F5B22DRAFT_633136 [Xylaria bambusicola]KAI0526712.1 hypothetical protein F5B22DRAFT_633136 [Xylaria bambusicola]
MFPIDAALLPSLATRKALLIVDAQNDFLAEDGALPITIPMDLPQKISDLATEFRKNGGETIWVQSQFERSRPVEEEQIMLSNVSSPSAGAAQPRGRRSRTTPPAAEPVFSPEAFLTPDAKKGPTCVRAGMPGTEMHPIVKQAVGPKDYVLTKTFYSAFRAEELLRILRVKLVTELFICGSLTNIGVMATAVDAASYGYNITIVDDCCGAQSFSRYRAALGNITTTTGCDTLPAAQVLTMMRPKPTSSERTNKQRHHHSRGATSGRSPSVRHRRGKNDDIAPSASDIQPSFEKLSLSGEPAATDEHAHTVIAPSSPSLSPQQHQRQRQRQPGPESKSQPQSQPKSTLQSLARPNYPQTKNRTDRDPVAATSNKQPSPTANNDNSNHSNDHVSAAGAGTRKSKKSDDSSHESVKLDKEDNEASNSSSIKPSTMTPQLDAQSSPLCEGDTKVIYNILPEDLSDTMFERIHSEVAWKRMSHQGGEVPRLVAVQGLVESDGSKPVYRHPADESPPLHPFTPAVDAVRAVVEKKLGHPLNHVLIQLYRAGTDYISEHSDKTLDIARGSFIANVSLGAERTMTLRTKREPKSAKSSSAKSDEDLGGEPKVERGNGDGDSLKRQVQRARLPHNSLFQMGLATNERWLHGIKQDKRAPRDKEPAELAYDGARISLTFRQIATFLTGDEARIWGQGATAKTRESAKPVINGLSDSAIAMLRAFGRENRDTEFDWNEHYGTGFDVLHMTAAKRLFLSGDAVVNMRLRTLLAELGVSYATGSLSGGDDRGTGNHAVATSTSGNEAAKEANTASDVPVKFVDNDEGRTIISGQRDIMLYVDKLHGKKETLNVKAVVSDRFEQGMGLLDLWRSSSPNPLPSAPNKETRDVTRIAKLLAPWEEYAAGSAFIAGPEPSLADFAFWPVLRDIFSFIPGDNGRGIKKGAHGAIHSQLPHLYAYNDRMWERQTISQIMGR